jgi:hypothetical protein
MERQKRKLKGIADLYNIEDERQKRQPSSAETISPQDIPKQDITDKTILTTESIQRHVSQKDISEENTLSEQGNLPTSPKIPSKTSINAPIEDVPQQNTSLQDIIQETNYKKTSSNQSIVTQNTSVLSTSTEITWSADLVDTGRGYFPIYNDFTDRMIREMMLDVYEQSVLLKMYRESRGWRSDECEVSHAEIVRSCNISKSQSQRTLAKLASKGLIVNMGRSKSGPERNRFKVLPGIPVIPHKNIFREDISREGEDVPYENKVPGQDISHANTNKNNNKELVNTHTQLGVGSKFSLDECRRFAEHLQKTGQGINNPGGYATTIHRTGEVDMLIESFLHPETSAPSSNLDTSRCPECHGSGFYYPKGVGGGVARCKHEQLREEVQEDAAQRGD